MADRTMPTRVTREAYKAKQEPVPCRKSIQSEVPKATKSKDVAQALKLASGSKGKKVVEEQPMEAVEEMEAGRSSTPSSIQIHLQDESRQEAILFCKIPHMSLNDNYLSLKEDV
ncbi:hypothetical protein RND71_034434 [Anisodus tanguticus]|uniref:Uncharacterized protein n=1 Tax=Anisodus tanguticus TaxID=243964 RepID=A0AAE1R9N7_9SOLA|nr:hypothetical protein RND71_034434 [Anisodus tanguticus]